jgi:hypothetical protein
LMNNLPFPRSYWVIPGQLLAGFFPGSKDPAQETANMEGLINAGIRHVINLMEEDELDHNGKPFRPYQERFKDLAASKGVDVTWERIPIRNVSMSSRAVMVIVWIRRWLSNVQSIFTAGVARDGQESSLHSNLLIIGITTR